MVQTKKNDDHDVTWNRISQIADLAAFYRAHSRDKEGFEEVLELIKNIVFFDAATLYLLNEEKGKLEQVAILGGRVELLSFLSVGAGDGLSGWTAHNRRPVLLSERNTISSFNPDNEYATFLSLPLLVEEEVIGVLNIGCVEARALTDNDIKLLTIIADQLALTIERLNYRDKIESFSTQLQKVQLQLQQAQRSIPLPSRLYQVAPVSTTINHGINNALSVIVGNVECLLSEKAARNQKSLSRLKRIENAALQIVPFNRKVLEISSLVQDSLASGEDARESNSEKKVTYEDI